MPFKNAVTLTNISLHEWMSWWNRPVSWRHFLKLADHWNIPTPRKGKTKLANRVKPRGTILGQDAWQKPSIKTILLQTFNKSYWDVKYLCLEHLRVHSMNQMDCEHQSISLKRKKIVRNWVMPRGGRFLLTRNVIILARSMTKLSPRKTHSFVLRHTFWRFQEKKKTKQSAPTKNDKTHNY